MTIDQVEKALDVFFKTPKQKILFLKGPWGSGKSYFIRTFLEQSDAVPSCQYFVSLFGHASLHEVREVINASLKFQPSRSKERTRPSRFPIIGKLLQQAGNAPQIIKKLPTVYGIPIGSFGTSLFWTVVNQLNSVIVLDDLERAKLPAHEVLGLASSLGENTRAKVVVIFNEGQLSKEDSEKVNEYREKVVDLELLFKPTTTDLVNRYLDEKELCVPVAELFDRMQCSNIRLLSKINFHLFQFEQLLKEHGIGLTFDERLHAVKLICLRYLSKVPLSADVVQAHLMLGLASDSPDVNAQVEAINALATKLEIQWPHPLDGLLFELIQNGYCTSDSLNHGLSLVKGNRKRTAYFEASARSYSTYNSNFTGTLSDVFSDQEAFLNEYAEEIPLQDLLSHFAFLSELGYSKSVQPWAEQHLRALDNESDPKVRLQLAQKLPRSAVIDAYIAKIQAIPMPKHDPAEIVKKIATSRSWNHEDLLVLDEMSDESFSSWLASCNQSDFIAALRSVKDMWSKHPDPTVISICKKITSALNKISKTSILNRARVSALFKMDD